MPPEQQKEQAIVPPEEANKTSVPPAVETPPNTGAKQDESRNPDGTFKKGFTGNPAGKPVGAKHLTTLLREAITKVSDGDEDPSDVAIIKKVVQMAKRGDLSAVSMIWGRLEGTIPQTMIMEGNAFAGLDDKQKAKLNALLGIEPEQKKEDAQAKAEENIQPAQQNTTPASVTVQTPPPNTTTSQA